jgi:hypothetical protein
MSNYKKMTMRSLSNILNNFRYIYKKTGSHNELFEFMYEPLLEIIPMI